GARHADRLRGDADAAALEVGKRDGIALPLLPQPGVERQAAILQHDRRGVRGAQAELLLLPGDDEAGRVAGDQEGADAALALVRIGDREDDGKPGAAA